MPAESQGKQLREVTRLVDPRRPDPEADYFGRKIYNYRQAGLSTADIQELLAEEKSLSIERIKNLLAEYIQKIRGSYSNETRSEVLDMELSRLDALQAAWWDQAVKFQDEKAANIVLSVMKTRHRLLGLDQPNGTDEKVKQQLLIIGSDTTSFMEALVSGRDERGIMPGEDPDDGGEAEEEP